VTVSRAQALGMFGATALLPSCASGRTLRVGSKNFTESFVVAEIYAQSLEAKGLRVDRRFDLGSVEIATAALQRGDIDLYPEYTGTALIDVLHRAPLHSAAAILAAVKAAYIKKYDAVWLEPSPMNDSQGLATTQAIARTHHLSTLSQLAVLAPQLRLATIQEFLVRPDGLPGLQKFYGGFHFKQIRTYDIGLKYDALLHGAADVATAFTTDGEIAVDNLVVLIDDKHFWPAYNVAPVVRKAALDATPQIASILNAVSPRITDTAARAMNAAVERDNADPADVAKKFLAGGFS
jgi:osmoprotectant transport system substrate-binding protein